MTDAAAQPDALIPELSDASGLLDEPDIVAEPKVPRQTPTVLFVNLDGANLTAGPYPGDATKNQFASGIGVDPGPYPPWGGTPQQREALLSGIRAAWSRFGVTVTDQRPSSGTYTMIMMGPLSTGSAGRAPYVCGHRSPSPVSFGFIGANQYTIADHIGTANQELAHCFGLEHTNQPGDIMRQGDRTSVKEFFDQCLPVADGNSCAAYHAKACPGGGQNAVQELLMMVGPSVPSAPDAGPPTVNIIMPNDGASFAAGATFEVVVDASDDIGVVEVTLIVNGTPSGTVSAPPFSFLAESVPAGSYILNAKAKDAAGNEGQSPAVTVSVGQATGPSTAGTSASGGSPVSTSAPPPPTMTNTSVPGPGMTPAATSFPTAGELADPGDTCACVTERSQWTASLNLGFLFALVAGPARRARK